MKTGMLALAALVIGIGLAPRSSQAAAGAVLVDFSSPHCAPCRAMQPVLEGLERQGVPIRHVDVSAEPHLASRYGIRQTPTYVIVAGGEEVTRLVGMRTAAELRAALATDLSGPLVRTGSQQPVGLNKPQTQLTAIGPAAAASNSKAPRLESMPSLSVAEAVERAQAATVRLRVYDGHGHGVGTGTIIDTHGQEALVLTCGHLFRETEGKGKIEVDLFVGGQTRQVSGQVLDYDANERDIALVVIRPGFPVEAVPVIKAGETVETGEAVFSFGCDRGADPSRRDTRITGVNKYNQHLGASNLEIAGAPIDGRSGGGLFDQQGRLVGVCNAADYEGDVGIYTGPGSVHWQLDRVNLAHLYRSPQATPSTEQLATAPAASGPAVTPASLSSSTGADSVAAPASASATHREVIVIIRDRQNPAGGTRTIELDRPSDELLRLLESEASR